MSPEQARGLRVDARTDIFSLGVVLYEMVTGQAPFAGATPADTFAVLLEKPPQPLAAYLPHAHEELEIVVRKSLEKDRAQRYQTAKELLADLKNLKHKLEFEADLERAQSQDLTGAPAQVLRGRQTLIYPPPEQWH